LETVEVIETGPTSWAVGDVRDAHVRQRLSHLYHPRLEAVSRPTRWLPKTHRSR
jgi:hypothetical protein